MIAQRMVIKVTQYSTGDSTTDMVKPATPNSIQDFINNRIYTYQTLSQMNSRHILTPRVWTQETRFHRESDDDGWGLASGVWYHGIRSYIDYCNGGDLEDLWMRYRAGQPQL